MAMWFMFQDIPNFKEEDLMQRVRDLGLMDGDTDGKIKRRFANDPNAIASWPPNINVVFTAVLRRSRPEHSMK